MFNAASGIIVTGTVPQAGKTVVCAGLSAVFSDLGFKVLPVKPLVFATPQTLVKNRDSDYFRQVLPVGGAFNTMPTTVYGSPQEFSETAWLRLTAQCENSVHPFLLETPGSLASAIQVASDGLKDATDLAKALNAPVLLVAPKAPDLPGTLIPALTYCWHKDVKLAGWIAVEAEPCTPLHWEDEVTYLCYNFNAPFLGCINYSPSISVPLLQQGNILRQTETGIDLLPLQHALNLTLPI
jgi:dethiobiotin synthetase